MKRKWFRSEVVFCERCGQVCDTACRLEASREKARVSLIVGRSWLR